MSQQSAETLQAPPAGEHFIPMLPHLRDAHGVGDAGQVVAAVGRVRAGLTRHAAHAAAVAARHALVSSLQAAPGPALQQLLRAMPQALTVPVYLQMLPCGLQPVGLVQTPMA